MKIRASLIIILSWFCLMTLALAQDVSGQNFSVLQSEQRKMQLSAAKERLIVAKQIDQLENSKLKIEKQQKHIPKQDLSTIDVTNKQAQGAQVELATVQAAVDSAKISLEESAQMMVDIKVRINALGNRIRQATLAPGEGREQVKVTLANLNEKLSYEQSLLDIEQQRNKILTNIKDTIEQHLQLEKKWAQYVNLQWQRVQQFEKQQRAREFQKQIQTQQQTWLRKVSELSKQLQRIESQPASPERKIKRNKLRAEIINAEEQTNLRQVQLSLLNLIGQVNKLSIVAEHGGNIDQLRSAERLSTSVSESIVRVKNLVDSKVELNKMRIDINKAQERGQANATLFKQQEAQLLAINKSYQRHLETIKLLQRELKSYESNFKIHIKKAIAAREGLPSFSVQAWGDLFHHALRIPGLALGSFVALKDQLIIAVDNLSATEIFTLIVLEFGLLLLWLIIRSTLSHILTALRDKRTSLRNNAYYIMLTLIRRNILGVTVVTGLLMLMLYAGIPWQAVNLVVTLAVVWFGFKMAIGLAHLTLMEAVEDVSGRDVKLYHELKWLFCFGAVVTTLTVLADALPVDYLVQDFFNRCLMLFLFILSLVLLKGRDVMPSLMAPYLAEHRPLRLVVRMLSIFIPLMILSNAIIGLFGYVELAWTIFKYEGLFLLVLCGYVLLRGVLIDVMGILSTYVIRHLRNGWLFSESLLKPIDRVLRVFLMLGAVAALFLVYGWGPDSLPYIKLVNLLNTTVFSVGETQVKVSGFIELIISFIVIYWVARWTREYAYRRLFSSYRDVGMRNSLSAFTQYGVVIVGIYFALELVDIDLTGFKFVLGGLAVGLGFGMRDLANNFVCGILLLIERPLRNGDLITIDQTEGRVTHIGMRSLTVLSWDHMEVYVPNSDIFSKQFTNWTRQDYIVRSVVRVTTQRVDDPREVQALIIHVLGECVDVVKEPNPQVYLKEIDDALLEFEVRFFLNIEVSHSRPKVRSDVLFAIWQRFEECGIKPPHPQQDIHVKTLPEST